MLRGKLGQQNRKRKELGLDLGLHLPHKVDPHSKNMGRLECSRHRYSAFASVQVFDMPLHVVVPCHRLSSFNRPLTIVHGAMVAPSFGPQLGMPSIHMPIQIFPLCEPLSAALDLASEGLFVDLPRVLSVALLVRCHKIP